MNLDHPGAPWPPRTGLRRLCHTSDKSLFPDYRNLLCLTAVFWMYQMAENKAVTGTVPQEYCLSHYFAADGKVEAFQSSS